MQARGGKIGNAGQDVGEPGFRVDVVEACRGDEGKHDGGAFGAALGTGEGPVAPSQSNAAQRSFGRVVAEADSAVIDEAGEVGPAPEHVVDWLQDLGRAREGVALAQQPGVHVVEKWFALLLPHGISLVSAAAVDGEHEELWGSHVSADQTGTFYGAVPARSESLRHHRPTVPHAPLSAV